MKKIFTLMLAASFVAGVFAQQPEAVIMKASVAPVIDAEIDEVWAEANVYYVDKPFKTEVPTVDGTTWKALWNEDGIFVLVECFDDEWLPMYLDNPVGTNDWEYDKPEIYFDVNYTLADGVGGGSKGSGHYQIAPGPTVDLNDGTPLTQGFWSDAGDIVTYSITVEDSDHHYEYFIPRSELVDGNGIGIDMTATIGFDVTMIDRDTGDDARKRAVWANTGIGGGEDESWNNMDDCGLVTFDGAVAGEYVSSVVITGGDVTMNNGTVQLDAAVLPEDATSKKVNWIVEDATGRVKISSDGLLTGVIDGTATIYAIATDGSYIESNRVIVNISNQIVSMPEINLIRNGYFEDLNVDGSPKEWNEWGAGGTVTEGVYSVLPDVGPNVYDFRLQQEGGWGLNTEDMYTLSFNLWADESDTINVDFEDARPDPINYNRYGVSANVLSVAGDSEWQWMSETERTKYVFDVQFPELVDEANEQFYIMLGHHTPMVYMDSIILVNDNDLAFITDYTPVESIVVSGETTVAIGASIQLTAAVLPQDALLTDVNWSVVNGTGWATIDASGMLTADSAGVVTVLASAKDDSKVEGVLDVSVSFPDGISQKTVNTLKVYPNPAVNELNVVLSSDNNSVSIYNSVGQKMDQVVVSGKEYKFDISSYAAGIYFVKTETSIAKFVK